MSFNLLEGNVVFVLGLIKIPSKIAAMIILTTKAIITEARIHCFEPL
jgi:hypothetical protein